MAEKIVKKGRGGGEEKFRSLRGYRDFFLLLHLGGGEDESKKEVKLVMA